MSQLFPETHLLKLVFVVVTKRISTRFLSRHNDTITNPAPRTAVDHFVTCPERYDFFLVSQSVRQRTVAPTRYMIYDATGLKPHLTLQQACFLTAS